MQIHSSLTKKITEVPVAATLGFFDGVHCGHAKLIQQTIETARIHGLESLLITFENHPSTYFTPEKPKPLLYTTNSRLELLKKFPLDHLLVLRFDEVIARKSAEEFLKDINSIATLHYLILGHDAVLGHKRQGDRPTIEKIAKEWGFHVEYLSPVYYEGKPISSSSIRQALQERDLHTAEEMMGHPYP